MFSVADKTAFCILSNIWEVFRPTRDCTLISVSFDQPPITSMMILYWFTSYPLYCFFSSHLNGPDTSKSFLHSSSLGCWSMGNSSLWLWLSCSYDSQPLRRPGWIEPPDDPHTQVRPTTFQLVLTCTQTQTLASLASTTAVLPREELGHVRSHRIGPLKPCYVWTDTCFELVQYTRQDVRDAFFCMTT